VVREYACNVTGSIRTEQFRTATPTADALPHRFCDGYLVKGILHGKEMTAFCAIIQDLVSGIGGSTVDAHEMVHGIVLISRLHIGVRFSG
jgi:hypothetical protein